MNSFYDPKKYVKVVILPLDKRGWNNEMHNLIGRTGYIHRLNLSSIGNPHRNFSVYFDRKTFSLGGGPKTGERAYYRDRRFWSYFGNQVVVARSNFKMPELKDVIVNAGEIMYG